MSYGLYINPQNGGKPFRLDDADCQMLTKLKHARIAFYPYYGRDGWSEDKGRKAWYTPVPDMHLYDAFVVVKKSTQYGSIPRNTGVWQSYIKNLWLESNCLYVQQGGNSVQAAWNDDPYKDYFAFDVFGTPKRTASDNTYGIQLIGMNGVTTLSDITKTGYCVWAGEIITKRFTGISVPGIDISNETRYSVYARPKTGEAVITRYGGSIQSDRDTILQVVVFDHAPNLTRMSGYGLEIYNSKGQVTYNTRYAPMLGGEVLDGRKGGYSKYANPIYNIGTYGNYVSDLKNKYYTMAACGLKISGNRYDVSFFTTVQSGWNGDADTGWGMIDGVFNTHCLDGSRYF